MLKNIKSNNNAAQDLKIPWGKRNKIVRQNNCAYLRSSKSLKMRPDQSTKDLSNQRLHFYSFCNSNSYMLLHGVLNKNIAIIKWQQQSLTPLCEVNYMDHTRSLYSINNQMILFINRSCSISSPSFYRVIVKWKSE